MLDHLQISGEYFMDKPLLETLFIDILSCLSYAESTVYKLVRRFSVVLLYKFDSMSLVETMCWG
jgi:hypothetical protein